MTALKDCGWTALARLENPDGDLITQSSITSITAKAFGYDGTETYSGTLTKTAVVFDILQGTSANPDGRWDGDSTGFNFAFEVPATAFATSGYCRVEFTFTPDAGEVYKLIYEGAVISSADA